MLFAFTALCQVVWGIVVTCLGMLQSLESPTMASSTSVPWVRPEKSVGQIAHGTFLLAILDMLELAFA